jgi:hypothetical protein
MEPPPERKREHARDHRHGEIGGREDRDGG